MSRDWRRSAASSWRWPNTGPKLSWWMARATRTPCVARLLSASGGAMPNAGASVAAPAPRTTKSATAKAVRGSSLLLLGKVLALGLNFVSQILIVRYLTKNDYGAFAYALSIV